MANRRVILVGKTGNGKSSTGNSILGYEAFESKRSLVAVTEQCEVREATNRANGKHYLVCDTPGLLDADAKPIERVLEIQASVQKCPKPHAFLLVFSCLNRLTKDEEYTIDLMRIMYGGDVFNHCIVVFTRGKEFTDDDEFGEFLSESKMLIELIKNCGNRVIRIENSMKHKDGVNGLLSWIEQVSSNGRRVFEYKRFGAHRDVLINHLRNYDGDKNITAQLDKICHDIKTKVTPEDWMGTIVAVGGAVAATALMVGRLMLK